jgi:hypothetical protein
MEYNKIFRCSFNSSDISKRCADDVEVEVIKTVTKTTILGINSLSDLVSCIFFLFKIFII